MTFSIVARNEAGTQWGTAVASRCLAVGRAVPAAQADIGAIATQAHCNLTYRELGLEQLTQGRNAQETVDELTGGDALASSRQLGIVDASGASASHTGPDCVPWAGGLTGPNYAIQGNILAGPHVVEAMERAWLDSDPEDRLGRRMLAALLAGDRAGGDRRGRQSAAILLVGDEGAYEGGSDEWANLRVDDHHDPVRELMRLMDIREVHLTRGDDLQMVPLEGALLSEVQRLLQCLGYPAQSSAVEDVAAVLGDWAFDEFLTPRVDGVHLDRAALDTLRERAGETWRHGGPAHWITRDHDDATIPA